MEFNEIIISYINQTENFQEAHDALVSMVQESPGDFIRNLLQLITTTEDMRLQENAINLLTVPISRRNGFYTSVDTSSIPEEIREEVKQVLLEMIFKSHTNAAKAQSVLCFYYQFCSLEAEALLQQMVEMLTPENAGSISPLFLDTIEKVSNRICFDTSVAVQVSVQLFNFITFLIENGDENLFEKKKLFIKTATNVLRYIYTPEDCQKEMEDIFSLIWALTKEELPVEGMECLKFSMHSHGQLIIQIPDIIEVVYSFLQSENEDVRKAAVEFVQTRTFITTDDSFEDHCLLCEGHEIEVIGMIIDFLSTQESTEIGEPESVVRVCSIALTNILSISYDTVIETVYQYSMEHLESESEVERFIAVLFFTSIMTTGSREKTEQYNEVVPQVIQLALQQDSPRIVDYGIRLIYICMSAAPLLADEQLIKTVAELVCSENDSISDQALEALFYLVGRCSNEETEELRLQAASLIFQYITKEGLEDNKRAELLRNLIEVCKNINPENSCTIIQPAIDLISQLMEQASEDSVPLSLSPAIGLASEVLSIAEKSNNPEVEASIQEFIESFFQFSTTLLTSDYMADGLNIIASIMHMEGKVPTEVLECANQLVIENLPTVSNKEILTSLLAITKDLIPYLNADPEKSDDETLALIFQSCYNYSTSTLKNSDFYCDVQRKLVEIVGLIFTRSPDIILSQVRETFEIIYPAGSLHSSTFNDNIRNLITACAPSFTEDPTYARVVSDTLFNVGFRAISFRNKVLDLDCLCALVQAAPVCDPSGAFVFPALRFIANNFEKNIEPMIEDKELAAKIAELLPEIPPPQEKVFGDSV